MPAVWKGAGYRTRLSKPRQQIPKPLNDIGNKPIGISAFAPAQLRYGSSTSTARRVRQAFAPLRLSHARLPPTREVITGGGGRHIYFKYTGPIPSTVSRIAPDTRGDGGYAIAPPSIHESGRAYTWLVDSAMRWPLRPHGCWSSRARNRRHHHATGGCNHTPVQPALTVSCA